MRFLGIEGGTIKDGMMGEAVKWLVANEAELRSAAPEGTEYLGPTPRYSHRTRIPGMSTSSMQWTPTERWIDKLLPQTLASANSLTNGAGSSTAHPERWAAKSSTSRSLPPLSGETISERIRAGMRSLGK